MLQKGFSNKKLKYNHYLGYNNHNRGYNMNLIKFLSTNSNTRKIFGKRELKIIEKQIWGIQLSQSEKNRLSRDIRKKLDFIKEVSKYEDEFDLKKGIEVKRIIEDTIEVIKKHSSFSKVKKIILYGSTVENERIFRSDIDIAVEFSSIDSKQAISFRREILGRADDKVDIQVYNFLPKKITKEIDKKGKILFKK